MKVLFIFITLFLTFDSFGFEKYFPAKISENFTLEGYQIKDAFELNSEYKVLIGRPEIHTDEDEGLRLIILKNDSILFVGKGQGESYIYRPNFYKDASDIIIICEAGAEYTWGVDGYILNNSSLKPIGFLNLGAVINKIDYPESVISLLRITKVKKDIVFDFPQTLKYENHVFESVDLIYKPGQEGSEIIPLDAIKYVYNEQDGLIMKK